MDLADPAHRATLRRRLSRPFAGRRVLLGPGPLAGYTPLVATLRAAGAGEMLVVATVRGAGPLPEDVEVVYVAAPPAATVSDEVRDHDRILRSLPDEAVAAIEAFDPDRSATWWASHFVTCDEPILGRPVANGRPAAFLALEDKLFAEELWAAVQVPRAASAVVPAAPKALARATAELAGPLGAVWTGDNREGFHGGGDLVRWVREPEDQTRALELFAARCDRVRVMPFLDGVPCSIHGSVLPDGTAVLRPVEIAILRDPGARRFVYGGLSTWWDPPESDRHEMRDVARRVGEHLRTRHGYRGGFGIDGVLTAAGFRPTELNTRTSGGAHGSLAVVDPSLFPLLQAALVGGHDPGLSVGELESVVPALDAQRMGKPVAVGRRRLGAAECWLDWDGSELGRADHPTETRLVIADTPSGFYARLDPCRVLAPGMRMAPLNAALARFLDREHDAGLGPAEPAPDLR